MKKGTIIWIIVGVLVLVGGILIWRAMDKSKQDAEDEKERMEDEGDSAMGASKKECRKNCRKDCKSKYKGKARRECKKDCKQECFASL